MQPKILIELTPGGISSPVIVTGPVKLYAADPDQPADWEGPRLVELETEVTSEEEFKQLLKAWKSDLSHGATSLRQKPDPET